MGEAEDAPKTLSVAAAAAEAVQMAASSAALAPSPQPVGGIIKHVECSEECFLPSILGIYLHTFFQHSFLSSNNHNRLIFFKLDSIGRTLIQEASASSWLPFRVLGFSRYETFECHKKCKQVILQLYLLNIRLMLLFVKCIPVSNSTENVYVMYRSVKFYLH